MEQLKKPTQLNHKYIKSNIIITENNEYISELHPEHYDSNYSDEDDLIEYCLDDNTEDINEKSDISRTTEYQQTESSEITPNVIELRNSNVINILVETQSHETETDSLDNLKSEDLYVILIDGRKYYACPYTNCNKSFKTKSDLNVHCRFHTGEKPYKCNTCDKAFNRSSLLKLHNRVHTGEKPYSCIYDGCEKCFKSSSDRVKHHRTHSGDRPFKCEYPDCDLTFTTTTNKTTHMKAIHANTRPYSCHECDKTFSNMTNFKNHQRIHSGEKPFKCDVCQKTFTEYSSAYKHAKIHRVLFCSFCPEYTFSNKFVLKEHYKTQHGDVKLEN